MNRASAPGPVDCFAKTPSQYRFTKAIGPIIFLFDARADFRRQLVVNRGGKTLAYLDFSEIVLVQCTGMFRMSDRNIVNGCRGNLEQTAISEMLIAL